MSAFLSPAKQFALVIAVGFSGVSGLASWAFTPDGDLLKVKGYSPEVILISDQQRNRQEWREPSVPRQKNSERFFHNFWYGNWTDSLDDFGSQVLRDD